MPVTIAIGSAASALIYFKAQRQYIGEKCITNRNNRVNLRCQNMIGLVLDSQPHEERFVYWVSSVLF